MAVGATALIAGGPSVRRTLVGGALVVWVVLRVGDVTAGVAAVKRSGVFYTNPVWFRDAPIRWLRGNAESIDFVYSDEPELVHFHTRIPFRRLPRDADFPAFQPRFREAPAPIVIVQPHYTGDLTPSHVRSLPVGPGPSSGLVTIFLPRSRR